MDKIDNIGLTRILTQSYDFDGFTPQEVWSRIAQRMNIIIEHFNYLDKKFDNQKELVDTKIDYLLNEGLNIEISNKLLELIDNGTLRELINDTLFKNVNDKIETLKSYITIREVYPELFGAKADYNSETNIGTDDTVAIQKAIDFAYTNNISVVKLGSRGYVIEGQLIIRPGITLKGTRESFTQTISTNTDNGSNRYRLITESTLKINPLNNNLTPLVFQDQSGIKNINIVYDQNFASVNEQDIIKYSTTIKAVGGFNAYNISFKGAYSLIEAEGEAIKIEKIYGWSYGKGIVIKNSDDVSSIKDIHLNPNITRPTVDCISLSKYRTDSIALEMVNCDGVNIENFFCICYRTGIKATGNNVIGVSQFTLSNFFMDMTGLAFDIDMDCGWASHITNGIVIYGFTNNSAHGGLIKFNKTNGNSIIQTINLSNINCNQLTEHMVSGINVDSLLNFEFKYGFLLNLNNITFDNNCKVINEHGSIVKGIVQSADYYLDLNSKARNIITNRFLTDIVDGIPKEFTKALPDDYTSIIATKTDDGYCKLSCSDNLSSWHGVQYRKEFEEKGDICVYIKFKEFNENTTVFIKWYQEDWGSPVEKTFNIDKNGVCMYRTTQAKIVDVYICPSTGKSGYCVIDEVKISKWNYA